MWILWHWYICFRLGTQFYSKLISFFKEALNWFLIKTILYHYQPSKNCACSHSHIKRASADILFSYLSLTWWLQSDVFLLKYDMCNYQISYVQFYLRVSFISFGWSVIFMHSIYLESYAWLNLSRDAIRTCISFSFVLVRFTLLLFWSGWRHKMVEMQK